MTTKVADDIESTTVASPEPQGKIVYINEYEDMDDWRVWPTEEEARAGAGPTDNAAVPYLRMKP